MLNAECGNDDTPKSRNVENGRCDGLAPSGLGCLTSCRTPLALSKSLEAAMEDGFVSSSFFFAMFRLPVQANAEERILRWPGSPAAAHAATLYG